MMTKNADKKREQIQMFCMDDMVPQNHMLRLIDKAINWNFIYELVEEKYSPDNGRPSMDPVMLIKIPFIQYLYGIKSMRQTIKEIEVNVAYRWFLGLDMLDPVPHFSTFGKNYTRRFKDTDLFEQIFSKILEECMKFKLVDTEHIFVDSTHVKACANSKKMRKRVAHEQALWYEQELKEEIQKDRAAHGKKPLKDNDKNDSPPPTASGGESFADETESQIPEGAKTQKCSTSDPESGWFRKGEHKHVFAYAVETACDKHGWILGYTVHPGNEHDSRTFPLLYEKIKDFKPDMMIMDAGYKTPAIAHLLLEDGIQPLFPYKRPMTKEGFFKKYEYAYDEYYDCYVCPGNQVLKYSTTNRDGYREYKSCGLFCSSCPYLHQCTESKDHVKDYDEENDSYICKNGKQLSFTHLRRSKSKTGYVSVKTIYQCKECKDCPYKKECIKGNNCKTPIEERNKVLSVAKTFLKYREEDLERILSDEGILLRINRSIQAEGSFGELKQDMQFRRYLSRGTSNVLAESILLAMAKNVNKLHNKIQKGKMGRHLFPLKSA